MGKTYIKIYFCSEIFSVLGCNMARCVLVWWFEFQNVNKIMLDKWPLQFFVIMQIFVVNKCVVFHFRKSLMEIFLSSTHKSFLQKEKFRKDIKGLVLTCTRYVSFWSRSTLISEMILSNFPVCWQHGVNAKMWPVHVLYKIFWEFI